MAFAQMNQDFLDLLRAFALATFIRNRQATGRTKDLADIEGLE